MDNEDTSLTAQSSQNKVRSSRMSRQSRLKQRGTADKPDTKDSENSIQKKMSLNMFNNVTHQPQESFESQSNMEPELEKEKTVYRAINENNQIIKDSLNSPQSSKFTPKASIQDNKFGTIGNSYNRDSYPPNVKSKLTTPSNINRSPNSKRKTLSTPGSGLLPYNRNDMYKSGNQSPMRKSVADSPSGNLPLPKPRPSTTNKPRPSQVNTSMDQPKTPTADQYFTQYSGVSNERDIEMDNLKTIIIALN